MSNSPGDKTCAGLVLAAGRSERMGSPKPDLAWGNSTILGEVIHQLSSGGLKKIFVVTNPLRKPKITVPGNEIDLNWILNEMAETSEMLASIQVGLASLPANIDYAFIALGDQPTIQSIVIRNLMETVNFSNDDLIFPSYRYHRGHPWVVHRKFWTEICSMEVTDTIRTFINQYSQQIKYVNFNFEPPEDMDTPDVYLAMKKKYGK